MRHFGTVDEELHWIAKDLGRRPKSERGGCVLLTRTRGLAEKAAQILTTLGVEAALAIRKTEFESTPIRWPKRCSRFIAEMGIKSAK